MTTERVEAQLKRTRRYLRRLLRATDSESRAVSSETTRLHTEIEAWLAAGSPVEEIGGD